MLEIFDRNPSSRVFHVDKECYVLYLGSHWDDYKPFLRLGTSVNLPAGLPPIVSTIVVPDVLSGSPLDESASLAGDATSDTHYVGDVKTINKLKTFLKQETIAVAALKKADHETDDNQHVYVYSYRDGNLKIKYHKSEIYDLHRRERQDGHFVARAQAIKNEFVRSPFKLPGEAYQRPGFAVVGGTSYLIARGEMAALSLPAEYFADLAAAGIDPDRLTTVHVGSADEALVRFFKRSRVKGKSPRVSTSNGVEVKALAGIFRANTLPALKVSVLAGSGGSFSFHRFTVGEAPGRIEATLQELAGPIVFGSRASGSSSATVVDSSAGTLTLDGRKRPLLDGCVYQLAAESLSRTFIAERYLPEKNYPYRDLLSADENNLLDQIAFYFSELFAGRDAGKVLRTIKSNAIIRDLSRGASLNPVTEIVLANTIEYIRFLGVAEPEAGNTAEGLANTLERHQLSGAAIPANLPLIAEISYREEVPYLFYRFASRITSDRVAHADRVAEVMTAVPLFDFESERNRLAELVAGLANPEQMEEARLRKIAERKKPKLAETTKPTEAEKPQTAADQHSAATVSGGRSGRRSGSGRRRGSSRGGPWRWILPVAVLVLLLIALGALLVTGTIPNRWFGEDTSSAGDDGGRDIGTSDGSVVDGTDASGTDGSTADTSDGTDADATSGTGTDGDGADGVAGDGTDGSGPITIDGTTLPEGWPPETLPAIRALEETPGVIITDDRVIGPGGIDITVMDIINLVNRIATENGYAPMHTIDPERPNPDWIYPENVFVLPNNTRYTVVEGDTLWDITVRYMVARLGQDYGQYVRLTAEYEGEETSDSRRGEIKTGLQLIGDESHSENFTRMVVEKLAEWRD